MRRQNRPAVPTASDVLAGNKLTAEYAHFLRELADIAPRVDDLDTLVRLIQIPGRLAQLAIDADVEPRKDGDVSLGTALLRFLNLLLAGNAEIGGYLLIGSDTYLDGAASSTYLTFGASFGGGWTAQFTTAAILELSVTSFKIYFNSGLTVGLPFTPTMVFAIDLTTGDITATRDVAIARDIAVTRNAAVTGDLDVAGNYKTGGTPGESTTITYLTGTPGSGQSSKTVTFTKGIETGHS